MQGRLHPKPRYSRSLGSTQGGNTMRSLSSFLGALRGLSGVCAILASVAVMSADHAESPGADADPAADLADVFIFPSPQQTSRTVGAITFGGRSAPRSRIDGSFYCDPNVLYTFHIDRANAAGAFDSLPEVNIYVRFGLDGNNQCGMQLENVPGAGGTFSGPIEQVFESSTGLRAFAGLRNDPFFFDAEGYAALIASFASPGQSGDVVGAFRLSGNQARRDSFANRNVSAIVFEMDTNTLSPASGSARPQVRVWSTTSRLPG